MKVFLNLLNETTVEPAKDSCYDTTVVEKMTKWKQHFFSAVLLSEWVHSLLSFAKNPTILLLHFIH